MTHSDRSIRVPGGDDPARATAAESEPPIEWTFNPWRQDLRSAVMAVVFLFFFGAVLYQFGMATLTSSVLFIALMFSLHPAFAVQRCRVDERGVARRMLFVWERRPWDRIGRAKVGAAGLWVWPSSHPGRLEIAFRGLWLPVPQGPVSEDERADLLSALRQRLGAHGL